MTREKAIKIIKEFINGTCLHLVDQEALETLIPELKESEDERIIRAIIDALYSHTNSINLLSSRGYQMEDIEAWLENQKPSFMQIHDSVMWDSGLRTGMELEKQKFEKQKECLADNSKTSASEDERIRKWLIDYFKEVGKSWIHRDISPEQILAYLEKQKEEEGYEAIPVESTLEYKLGFKAGKESEKQKETGIRWFKTDNVKNPDKPYIDKAGRFYTTDGRMCHVSEIEKQKEHTSVESELKFPDWVHGNWDDEYMINTVIGRYSLHAEVARKRGDTHDYNLSKSMESWLRSVVKPLIVEKHQEQKHTIKFKVSDKVHLEGDDVNILTITGIEKDRYLTDCGPILFGAEDMWQIIEQKPIKWTDLTWKDIVELEGIINNVHYDFSAGIGQESFGKEVLERFCSTKGIEYLDEAEQKCWREEGQKEQKPVSNPKWAELTWKDINELERIINNVHYEFQNGIGEDSFGELVLERFKEYKDDGSMDEQKPAECERQPEFKEVEYNFRGEKVKVMRPFFRDDKGREFSTTGQDTDLTWSVLREWCEIKGITPYDLYPRVEWSEEDEEMLDIVLTMVDCSTVVPHSGGQLHPSESYKKDISDWLKSFRPPQDRCKDCPHRGDMFLLTQGIKSGKHELASEFMNYLDENRPEEKTSLSNAECKDIDEAFKECDWAKIMRYVEKYSPSWKPSEHQMTILKAVKDYVGKGSGYWGEGLGSLIDDLEKLM